jgi:shikimate dehydrogenase
MLSGTTHLIGIVGHPVAQVQMPSSLNTLFSVSGKDLAMVPFDIAPDGLPHFMAMLRTAHNLLGTVVTMPHKQAAARLVDLLTERAKALGAVNVVRRTPDGTLCGDHVDGFGFLAAARKHGFVSVGKKALVVGAGGAGSAIAYALCETGIASVAVLDTDATRSSQLAQLLGERFPGVDVRTACRTLAGLDLVANVTPLGMRDDDPMPLPDALLATLSSSTLVCDAITSPVVTPFLKFARRRGCWTQTGVEMAQASVQFVGSLLRFLPEIDPAAVVAAPLD